MWGLAFLGLTAVALCWALTVFLRGVITAARTQALIWRAQRVHGWHDWRVISVTHHGACFHLELTPASAMWRMALGWLHPTKGGQYLTLQANTCPRSVRRRYSLARLPRWSWRHLGWVVELAIKREPNGLASNWLGDQLRPGLHLPAQGPAGAFCWPETVQGEQVLIGAGIGFTPMRAMVDEWLQRGRPAPLTFVWVVRHEAEWMGYLKALQALAQQTPSFKFVPVLTGPAAAWRGEHGRPTAQRILAWAQTSTPEGIWMCASAAMMDQLIEQFQASGLPARAIHFEAFSAPANSDHAAYEVRDTLGRTLTFSAEPSLLSAMVNSGWPIAHDCRNGSCGACLIRVEQGQTRQVIPAECTVPSGACLACTVVPQSALLIKVPG